MRLLIKFGYDGTKFTGYQAGNGKNSVEGTILSVMEKHGIALKLNSAARTDRSVSASGNAFCIETEQRPTKVLGILNSQIPDMLFHSFAVVDEGFNPRHCDQKEYSYLVVSPPAGMEKLLKLFEGTHDFSNFCRRDQRNPVRTIDKIEIERKGEMAKVKFHARSFVWEQIRSIMGYVLADSDHERDPFSKAPGERLVAAPEPLILEDIRYSEVSFRHFVSQSKKKYLERERISKLMQLNLYEELTTLATEK